MKKPVVRDNQIVIRDMMTIVYTLDHRFGDAAVMIQFLKIVAAMIEDPENFNPDMFPQLPFYEDIIRNKKQA